MKVQPRVTVTAPEISTLVLAGAALCLTSGFALVITIWTTFGPVPALAVALALSIAGTAWARSVDAETRHLATLPRPPARFRDPEDDTDEEKTRWAG